MAYLHILIILLLQVIVPINTLVDDSPDARPNEYFVRLGPNLTVTDVLETIEGSKVLKEYKIGSVELALFKLNDELLPLNSDWSNILLPNVIVYAFDEGYKYATQDPGLTLSDTASNTQDTGYGEGGTGCSSQDTAKYWGLTRISQRDLPQYEEHDQYYYNDTGDNVTIFVVDTGVNTEHETFGGRAATGYVDDALMASEGAADLSGHGTHVAGLAAGSIHGTAKLARIISVKVMNKASSCYMDALTDGLYWIYKTIAAAPPHAKFVINLSLGFNVSEHRYDFLDDILEQIPAVSVAAAGNSPQVSACNMIPASYASVVAVAATAKDDKLYRPSSRGKCVNILAPGARIMSASNKDTHSEATKSGTSMAAGFVSGVVARHLETFTHRPTTQDMIALLQDTASKNKTNAGSHHTPDFLLFASCPADPRPPGSEITKIIEIVVSCLSVMIIIIIGATVCAVRRKTTPKCTTEEDKDECVELYNLNEKKIEQSDLCTSSTV